MYNTMRVQKRNGDYEDVSFDKILKEFEHYVLEKNFHIN